MRLLFGLLVSSIGFAQTAATPLPAKHIPPSVLMELRQVENQFDLALSRDCAPEKCVSKGCVYRDHAVVDMPRNGSLPGLPQEAGPGSVPAQEYLTQARCDFAHEKSLSARDVQALVRRLEQRLSKGWLEVSVGRQILEPISPRLAESPPPKPEVEPKVEEPVKAEPPLPTTWDTEVAIRELWLNLLPHFSWMIALIMVTLAALILIWAFRRLGRQSEEEKALMAAMMQPAKEEPAAVSEPMQPQESADKTENTFVSEQQKVWAEKMAQAELSKNEGLVVELLHHWLKAREFPLLAKAIFLFGDQLTLAFAADPELAELKVEFAEYLRQVDANTLPSDEEFYKTLNQHAISSSLLSQSDAETYRSLKEQFGSSGVASLMKQLQPRQGAVLFALLPREQQLEVSRMLAPEVRVLVSQQLLASNRVSREERGYVFQALDLAKDGLPLPPAPVPAQNEIVDRGSEFDAAGALSTLLPHIAPEARQALFSKALHKASGVFPRWYENILYPEMLLKLPNELQADMMLEVDLKGLAGFSSVQPKSWQNEFFARLTPSLQKAVRANMAFSSRAEQMTLAQRGHNELVEAVKRRVAQGAVSFPELVA